MSLVITTYHAWIRNSIANLGSDMFLVSVLTPEWRTLMHTSSRSILPETNSRRVTPHFGKFRLHERSLNRSYRLRGGNLAINGDWLHLEPSQGGQTADTSAKFNFRFSKLRPPWIRCQEWHPLGIIKTPAIKPMSDVEKAFSSKNIRNGRYLYCLS